MDTREIVLNLWYVRDEERIIYSLRVRTYVCEGSDEEKLAFLQQRASLDYLVADPFEIPERFHIFVLSGTTETRMPVAHVSMLPRHYLWGGQSHRELATLGRHGGCQGGSGGPGALLCGGAGEARHYGECGKSWLDRGRV